MEREHAPGPGSMPQEWPRHELPEDRRRFTASALWRSAAAAAGATAGVLLSVPLGVYLAVTLFEHLGVPLMDAVISGPTKDMPFLEKLVAFLFLAVAAIVIAVDVVVALVAPIFVVVPLLVTAVALRLARAGLITRTLWLMLAAVVGLAVVVLPTLSVFDGEPDFWLWVVLVAGGAFAGRFVVELWKPDLAGRPAEAGTGWRRWKGLGLAWLILLAIAVVGIVVLVLLRLPVQT